VTRKTVKKKTPSKHGVGYSGYARGLLPQNQKKLEPELNSESIEKLQTMNKNEKLNFLYEIATSKNFKKNINKKNLKFEDEVKKFYINDDKYNKKTSDFYKNNLDEK